MKITKTIRNLFFRLLFLLSSFFILNQSYALSTNDCLPLGKFECVPPEAPRAISDWQYYPGPVGSGGFYTFTDSESVAIQTDLHDYCTSPWVCLTPAFPTTWDGVIADNITGSQPPNSVWSFTQYGVINNQKNTQILGKHG